MSAATNAAVATAGAPPSEFCTQVEFARLLGVGRSYVTALKHQQRLVLNAEGLVDVTASLERIRGTTGALGRAAAPVQGADFSNAQERDKYYSAEIKRIEYERMVGALMKTEEVHAMIDDAGAALRAALEAWPATLAPQLAALAGDEARMRALLAEHVEAALEELALRFSAGRALAAQQAAGGGA